MDWGQLGTPKNDTFETHALTDRVNYGVNIANGNLVVASTDLNVAGPWPQPDRDPTGERPRRLHRLGRAIK